MDGLYVEGITKTYGTVTVVDNVSFHAAQGKILGLLGPNGAGKTTILRMIMGITAPDRGQVFFQQGNGRIQGGPPLLRRLSAGRERVVPRSQGPKHSAFPGRFEGCAPA